MMRSVLAIQGSSPLTRGKRADDGYGSGRGGLIPAHAGKTTSTQIWRAKCRAHPRSRGENSPCTTSWLIRLGSSPLTRGKRGHAVRPQPRRRLIPAHAGKTEAAPRQAIPCTAHPRSRGENDHVAEFLAATPGSSPLTRGKHLAGLPVGLFRRLIPAHAGKTTCTGL